MDLNEAEASTCAGELPAGGASELRGRKTYEQSPGRVYSSQFDIP